MHLDLGEFRKEVMAYQSMRTTDITHPKGDGYEVGTPFQNIFPSPNLERALALCLNVVCAQIEYRVSMGLEGKVASTPEQEALLKDFPKFRVAYEADYS